MAVNNTEKSLEKALRDEYRDGYTTGWTDALQMAASLLNRIATQRKCADANRWANGGSKEDSRDEDENWYTELDDPKIAERSEE